MLEGLQGGWRESMGRIYDAVDSVIMNGVNAGVRLWNHATGRTKADLANTLNTLGLASYNAGMFYWNKKIALAITPIQIICGTADYIENKREGEREQSLGQGGLKDIEIELSNNQRRKRGPVYLSIGAVAKIAPEQISSDFLGLGMFLQGLGQYVMRADYVPPKKSILSQAADNLSEGISRLRLAREPVNIN
jgi:hypothetical protein